MNRLLGFLGGVGVGAALQYFFDMDRGKRRRAMLRDQVVHLYCAAEDGLATAADDLSHRLAGQAAVWRARLRAKNVPDDVLVARIRSKLGRHVSHPGAIAVEARQGQVVLSGAILAHEVKPLLARVASLPGVRGVENRLDVYRQPGDNPSLQGHAVPPGEPFELLQENWAPAARLFVSLAGGLGALWGLRRRGIRGFVAGTLGLGMLARALTNLPLSSLLGLGGRRAVDVHKTVSIDAPLERVFAFWQNPESFPRFMARVREVKSLGDGRYHWAAVGPGGSLFEWDAVVTRLVPNRVLAWKSVPGSLVANAGVIHFQPNPDGSTRVDIQMSYNPPAGALGHAVAMLLGMDAKRALDEDLVRLKSLLEFGKTTVHGRTVTSAEIEEAMRGGWQEPRQRAA